MKNNVFIFFTFYVFGCNVPVFSQMDIIKDTAYFQNNGKNIMVVHTTNRQYYDDSTCVWEVMYPEIFNLENRIVSASVNIMLSQEIAFGDCNDKECDRTSIYFPQLSRFWDKVKITGIRNDLLSYCLMEGHCPVYSKLCSGKIQYRLFNLKSGLDIEMSSLFKKEESTQKKLDSLILAKLHFIPEDIGAIRSERQFYFEAGKLFVFYDWYTIGRMETYVFELPYAEIQNLINPSGVLSVFFKDISLSKK